MKKHRHMTDTRTPLQKELQAELHTLTKWDDINSFVAKNFPPHSRKITLTALEKSPMDTDYIEWRGIVDYAIRTFL